MRLCSQHAAARDVVPEAFWSVTADARVSLTATHSMLCGGVELLRDEQLGLKLGRSMSFGAGGPFDYAVRSAATVRDSIAVAATYSKLLADSFHLSFESWRERALIRLDDETGWPSSAGDFAVSSIYRIHIADHVPAACLEAWFPRPAPDDMSEYERSFPGVTLKFGAPFHGFAFNPVYADAPMPGADPALHALLRERVDALMALLSASRAIAPVVRRLVAQELRTGAPTAEGVARALRMSHRTMSRRLELEHTTFNAELDTVRREQALDLVSDCAVPLAEIAFRLRFSHIESFHRAFKRWTGLTPAAYRKSRTLAAALPHRAPVAVAT
jgi:AraC-like DNA-binding protein